MKTLEIERANEPLSSYTKSLGNEILVLTQDDEPIYAIVSLKNVDRESLALSTNPEFLKIIEKSRAEFRAGKKLSFQEMKKRVAQMD